MSLAEWQEKIHANAVAKGWWETERPWNEVRILVVSEIAEALEEYRAGRMGVWFAIDPQWRPTMAEAVEFVSRITPTSTGRKPEGFPVEIADAAIRLLDYAGFRGWSLRDTGGFVSTGVPSQLDDVVSYLYDDFDGGSSIPECVESALGSLYAISVAHHFDLWEMVALKHAYNETRSYRHGGKAA